MLLQRYRQDINSPLYQEAVNANKIEKTLEVLKLKKSLLEEELKQVNYYLSVATEQEIEIKKAYYSKSQMLDLNDAVENYGKEIEEKKKKYETEAQK